MASLAASTSSQGQGVGIVGGGFPPSGGCTSSSPGVHERAPKFSACYTLSPSVVVVSLLELDLHLYGLLKYLQIFQPFGVSYCQIAKCIYLNPCNAYRCVLCLCDVLMEFVQSVSWMALWKTTGRGNVQRNKRKPWILCPLAHYPVQAQRKQGHLFSMVKEGQA